MSRIGKQPIEVPDKVNITIDGENVLVKGPLGELSVDVPSVLSVKQEDNLLTVEVGKKSSRTPALWGLYRSLLNNMVKGVSKGFEKKLQIEGVGYRAETQGNKIVLNLGYSHPIEMEVPEGIKVEVEKSTITVSGADKQLVGQFAADIRSKRKPEPYKGKGIRYENEHVRRKAGKRAVGTAGA
ncbi:MAG: 50S ribosomal protein L6 [Candidatus Spechtbacterales bacterium]|nr:50S ribosomal protein L6 [Candidatus Spechtbacterales bacterium]